MRILVTGANGFVGQHVIKSLVGHRLVSNKTLLDPSSRVLNLLVNTRYEQRHPWSTPEPADHHDAARSFAEYLIHYQPDTIIHLAATCGGIGANKDAPGKFIYENLQMGLNVLEGIRMYGPERVKLINLGSVCMYPKHTPTPFQESEIWNGYPEETNAPYGIAKRAIIEASIAYHKQYGLNVWNLIPVNMAGEFDHFNTTTSHVVPAMICKFSEARRLGRRSVTLWGTGQASREFLYAGDCAEAIVRAILSSHNYPYPINIGTGHEISMSKLAIVIAEKTGFSGNIIWDHAMPDGQPRRCLDTSLAYDVLGFKAQTSLDTLLDKTIAWYEHARIKGAFK